MNIPSTLVLLGYPIEIETVDSKYIYEDKTYYLATNAKGTELWILQIPIDCEYVNEVPKNALKMFQTFAGFRATSAFRFTECEFAKTNKKKVLNIKYRSPKWTRKNRGYIHTFENLTYMYCDNIEKPTTVLIRGRKLRVKKEGITG